MPTGGFQSGCGGRRAQPVEDGERAAPSLLDLAARTVGLVQQPQADALDVAAAQHPTQVEPRDGQLGEEPGRVVVADDATHGDVC